MTRLFFAGAFLVAGLFLAGIFFAHGQPISALASAMAAVYLAIGIVIGITTILDNPSFQFAALIIGLIGVIGVFKDSRGLHPQVAKVHANALNHFVQLDLLCPNESIELQSARDLGIKACALQNNSDQMSSLIDLIKAQHLGPISSLADSAISIRAAAPDYCAIAFKAAVELCPTAFASLAEADRQLLIDLASSP